MRNLSDQLTPRVMYTLGRGMSLTTRPAILFIANNYLSTAVAGGVAVAFLTVALALLFTAADPHRKFYLQRFSSNQRVNGLTFYVYVWGFFLLALCGFLLILVLGWWNASPVVLIMSTLFYFSSEKLVDEILRLKLFEKDFSGWGVLSMQRCIVQLLGVGFLLAIFVHDVSAWAIICVLGASNFLIFLPRTYSLCGSKLNIPQARYIRGLTSRSVKLLFENRRIWAFALLMASWGYIDRVIAMVMDKQILPLFMLVATCFSLIPTIFDFYYLSRHRRDFLEQKISMRGAILSFGFLGCLFVGVLLAVVVCMVLLFVSKDGDSFPLVYLPALATIQLLLSITYVPHQILYWSRSVDEILKIELTSFALGLGMVGLVIYYGFSLAQVLFLVVVCLVVRLALYFFAERSLRRTLTPT